MRMKRRIGRVLGLNFAIILLVSCSSPATSRQETTTLLPIATQPTSQSTDSLVNSVATSPPSEIMEVPQLHVIWDDDGSPDGVIALLYFLKNPDISVDAITVSCGEAHPNIFADNLMRMLVRLGRTGIPVAGGRSTPLEGVNAFPEPWRVSSDEFWEVELPNTAEEVQPLDAAELIVKVLNESTNPVTVFVSGTHTNLAEALRMDPSIVKKIASVQVMGGALYVPGNIESDWSGIHNQAAEWNIWVDPVAASEVFNSGVSISVTPLDATKYVLWTSSDAASWEASGTPEGILAAEILRWMLRNWYPEGVYAWDLVTAVNTTEPSLCQQRQLHIQVVTEPGNEEGRTIVVSDRPANVTACLEPEADETRDLVAQTFSAP